MLWISCECSSTTQNPESIICEQAWKSAYCKYYIYINNLLYTYLYVYINIRIWICILYLYYIYMLQKNILVVSVSHYCYSKSTICYHNCTIKKMCQSTHECIFTSLPQNCTRNIHVIMSIYDEMSPLSVQFTNTNSLRCLHSILSLFKRTWRFSAIFLLRGSRGGFRNELHLRQMPRWFFCKPTRSHHAKKRFFNMFKTKIHLLVIRKVVDSCVDVKQ